MDAEAVPLRRLAEQAIEDVEVGGSGSNVLDMPTEEAIRRVAPDTVIRSPIEGYASAFDTGKAKRIVGWEPRHSWRDAE